METAFLIGKIIGGKYRIDKLIGKGGFASVYKAYQLSLGRPVAIKVLENEEYIERFKLEASVVLSLRHPNIVRVLDMREYEGYYFIVMDYIEGTSLRTVLSSRTLPAITDLTLLRESDDLSQLENDETVVREPSPEEYANNIHFIREPVAQYPILDPSQIAKISVDICNALAYAHEKGIVHRDVKPENILLSSQDKALLTDFGIAKVRLGQKMTQTGVMLGSVPYMSPEQFLGEEVDHRSDIYSLGVVMYEMLVGSPPFTGTIAEIMKGHLKDEPVPPSKISPDIPDVFDAIILRCLTKEKRERYSSAAELLQSIRSVVTPASFVSLISISSIESYKKDIHSDEEYIGILCNNCGYVSEGSVARDPVICPVCGRHISIEESGALQNNEIEKAQEFVSAFDLSVDLDLNIRHHEYIKRIRPLLEDMYELQCQAWKQIISKGSVMSPLHSSENEEDLMHILEVVRSLFGTARLWNYVVGCAFVVSGDPERIFFVPTKKMVLDAFRPISATIPIDEERHRTKYINGLLGRAYQLIGLYYTKIGAHAQKHKDMKEAYESAATWFDMATRCFSSDYPEYAISTKLSCVLCKAISHYDDIGNYKETLKDLVSSALNTSSPMDWVIEDVKVARLYGRANDIFNSLIVRAQNQISKHIERILTILDKKDAEVGELKHEEIALREEFVAQQKEIQKSYERKISKIKRIKPWIIGLVMVVPVILSVVLAYLIPRLNIPLLIPVLPGHREIFSETLVSLSSGYLLGKLTKGIPGWTDMIFVLYVAGMVYFQLIPWPVAGGMMIWFIALYAAGLRIRGYKFLGNIAVLIGFLVAVSIFAFMWLQLIDGIIMILGTLLGFYVQRGILYAEYEALQIRGEQLRESEKEIRDRILKVRRNIIDLITRTDDQVKHIISDEVLPIVEHLENVSRKYSLILLRYKTPEEIGNLNDIRYRIQAIKGRLTPENEIEALRTVRALPLLEDIHEEAVHYKAPPPLLAGIKLPGLVAQILLTLVIIQGITLVSGKHWERKRGLDLLADIYETYKTTIVHPTPTSYLFATPTQKRMSAFLFASVETPSPTPKKLRTAAPRRTPTRVHHPTRAPHPTYTYVKRNEAVASPTSRTKEQVFYVTAQRLNVRTGPGTNYRIITQLVKGQRVIVGGLNQSGKWSYIKSPVEGWVSSKYISESDKESMRCIKGYVIEFVNQSNLLNEIYGKVINYNGRGIANLRMEVYVPFYEDTFHAFTTTDRDGSFYWAGLNPQNEYAVKIVNPPYKLLSPVKFRYGSDHQRAIIEFRVTTCR